MYDNRGQNYFTHTGVYRIYGIWNEWMTFFRPEQFIQQSAHKRNNNMSVMPFQIEITIWFITFRVGSWMLSASV